MFALRGLRSATGECAHLPRQAVAVAMQQARRMSAGDDEDEALYVNWWDAPTNPGIWHRHHLAWFGAAFWGAVFYLSFGGKSKPPEATTQSDKAVK